jgi:hypothetical protein
MRVLRFNPQFFGLCATVGMLAGCGGTQTASNAVPQGVAAQSRARQASGSSGDLLYILTNYGITIVSYPDLQIVDNITGYPGDDADTICSDPKTGNVFVPTLGNTVVEYTHGGTTPIATLYGPSGYTALRGCSVDPTTGNLAVDSAFGPYGLSGLEIFPKGSGTPTVYTDKILHLFDYTAYDGAGNLFVTAYTNKGYFRIGELALGQSKLLRIRMKTAATALGKIQWDGTFLAGNTTNAQGQDSTIYQVQINGTKATVAGTVSLKKAGGHGFWVYNGNLFAPYGIPIQKKRNMAIAVWPYPAGGKATSKLYGIVKAKGAEIHDITMSVAPSHSRVRK